MSENSKIERVKAGMVAPTLPVRTWRQRLGLSADFPLYMPTDVERAMVAEIADLRQLITTASPRSASTDLSHRLRETADQQPGWKSLLTAAADEIERYYGGMLAWKQTAEKKDRDWNAERMGRVNDRIAANAAAAASLATLTTVDCPACNGKEPCDECHGQGKVIVSRADLAAAFAEHADSEGGHHD